ncbi:MAG: (E)-4-hydroxy-3-methylbut-2-enyl-diphosphate synthase [Treponema sp.]|nr:(E)-4-hydroxy-3-methylbut-2-enyl-diphosphate synthase [Treponema sp.]MCL2238220.1 (E)-4-hydroxy-3-methylbut-2-enyl-diphosphate synthase [Treponema sp.]
MKQERISKVVKIGGFSHVRPVFVGGNHPIVIQTMWKDKLLPGKLDEAAARIGVLGEMGCGLLRFAVPDIESAQTLGKLAEMVSMPLVADIHFDYKIALRCLDFPIAKIRLNPGNIGGKEKVKIVLEKAGSKNIPIRIGVNAGSLPADLRHKVDTEGLSTAEALVQAAQREMSIFDEFGFTSIIVSMKASTIADTISTNIILSGRADVTLHVGVTEAGPLIAGVTRNTAALVHLLKEGVGDTVRVSLSDTMENEVIAGREIIAAASQLSPDNKRLGFSGVNIVSCPRCARAGFDTHGFTSRWMPRLYSLKKDITAAVMGCEVNGPQEAKHADIGITGAGDKVLIFKHGKIIRTITADQADAVFEEELGKI